MTAKAAARRIIGARGRAYIRHARTARRLRRPSEPLRLHLGCGQRRLEDWINVDHNWSDATDYVCDISRLPCPPRSVECIESYHVIEHIPITTVRDVLTHWQTLLRSGGTITLECPDLAAAIRQLEASDEERMFTIFGRQRFPGDAHHWGYTAVSLVGLLEEVGYVNARALPATDYHAERSPCIRVEAQAS